MAAAEEAFVDARSGNEVDMSGTGREAFSLEEQGRLRDQLLINLRRFASGDVPPASFSDRERVDRALNDAYQRIEQSSDTHWRGGTANPSGIRDTQGVLTPGNGRGGSSALSPQALK